MLQDIESGGRVFLINIEKFWAEEIFQEFLEIEIHVFAAPLTAPR